MVSVGKLLEKPPLEKGRRKMAWVVVAIIGAGAAAGRAAWGLMKAYERLASARDELDDSLHTHRNEPSEANSARDS